MSREILELSKESFAAKVPEALKRLRETLGKSKAEMARELKCGERLYKSWEDGQYTPGGAYILMMLDMCPDEECVKNFGIDIAKYRRGEKEERTKTRGVFLEPTELPKRRTQH